MIVFVKTRYTYDSYTDYWKLVELSGYPVCYTDEVDLSNEDNVYIVSPHNGEWRPVVDEQLRLMDNRCATTVMWNLERPSGSGGIGKYISDNRELMDFGYYDVIVVSDRALADRTGFHYIPMGIHEGLGEPGAYKDKYWDVIHLSCYSGNRAWLFDSPVKCKEYIFGNEIFVAPNAWGDDRHDKLQRSRFMLNVHQDGNTFLEPLRFTLAAAYGLLIFSEYNEDEYPYRGFVDNFNELKRFRYYYDEHIYDRGLEFRQYMLDKFTFRDCIDKEFS